MTDPTRIIDARQRLTNAAIVEQREYATGRLVRHFAWFGAGVGMGMFGVAFADEFEWRSWLVWMYVSHFAAALLLSYGIAGILFWQRLAFQDVPQDEYHQRMYEETAPQRVRIVQQDGKTIRMTDLGLSPDEAMLVAERLHRAKWHWSKRVLKGKPDEDNITNIDARYGDMLAEMRRVGALELVNGQSYVSHHARAEFIAASPTLSRIEAKNRATNQPPPVVEPQTGQNTYD